MPIKFTPAQQAAPQPGYQKSGTQVLKDPRFLNDLRQYYRNKGVSNESDDQLVERFYSDQTWGELNSVSLAKDVAEAYSADENERARMRRLAEAYQGLPYFWEEGGRGALDYAADAAPAIAADPLNLLPGAKGVVAGRAAARAALAGGQTTRQALRSGVARGARSGAIVEGGVSAGVEAGFDVGLQARDIELGLQDDYSLGRTALAGAAGGVGGGAIGGLIGAGAGYAGARATSRTVNRLVEEVGIPQQRAASLTEEEAQAILSGEMDAAPIKREEQAQAQGQAQQQAEDVEPPSPEEQLEKLRTEEFRKAVNNLESRRVQLREHLETLIEDQADEDTVAEVERALTAVGKLTGIPERLRAEQDEITRLFQTNDPRKIAEGERLLAKFERDLAQFKVLTNNPIPEDVESFLSRYRQPEGEEAATEAGAASTEQPSTQSAGQAEQAGSQAEPSATQEGASAESESQDTVATSTSTPGEDGPSGAPADAPDVNITGTAKKRAINLGLDYTTIEGTGKNGQITAADVRRAAKEKREREAAQGQPAQPARPEEGAVVAAKPVRELAAERGVDITTLQGSGKNGRILKKDVENAAAEAANEASGNLARAEDELAKILDEVVEQGGPEFAQDRELVELLARSRQGSQDIARQVMDVYDVQMNKLGEFSDEIGKLTTTEKKRARRLAKNLQARNPDLTEDEARTLSEMRVMSERGRAPQQPDATRTSRPQGEATPYETKGRSPEVSRNKETGEREERLGRIQSILKRGAKTSGGRTVITSRDVPRQSQFGLEEALAKADLSKDKSVQTFTATGETKVVDSATPLKAGEQGFVDPISRRAYRSFRSAKVARGEAPAPKGLTPGQKTDGPPSMEDIVKRFKETGDYAQFQRDLADFKNREAGPAQPNNAPTPDEVPAERPGEKIVAVRRVDKPNDVRVLSEKQIADGKGVEALIGKRPLDQFEVRYVPRETAKRGAQAKREAFEAAEPAGPGTETPAPKSPAYGSVTGDGEPMKVEDFRAAKLTPDQISGEEAAVLARLRGWDQEKWGKAVMDAGGVQGETLVAQSERLENARWPKNLAEQRKVAQDLRTLYDLQKRLSPGGYLMEVDDRAAATENIRAIMAKFGPETQDQAVRFIENLGGNREVGPRFQEGQETPGKTGWAHTFGGKDLGGKVEIGPNNPANMPAMASLYHEVAHWAYRHILTPDDRAQFWGAMDKYYTENLRLQRSVPTTSENWQKAGPVNALESPQELFANQFSVWATRNRADAVFRDETFWQRMANYVKAVFDRYVRGVAIDPDLEPLFSKILPEDERQFRKLGTDAQPQSDFGQHIHKRFRELQMLRQDWDAAMLADSPDQVVNVAMETARHLASVGVSQAESGRIAARTGQQARATTGTFAPYRPLYKILRDRIDDLYFVLKGKTPSDDLDIEAEFADIGSISNPEQVMDDLIDLFDHGSPNMDRADSRFQNSSLRTLFDLMETKLQDGYIRAENKAMATPPPSTRPGRKEPATDAQAESRKRARKVTRKARQKQERVNTATDNQAKSTVNTKRGDRQRSGKRQSNMDASSAKPLKGQSLDALRKEFRDHRGTERGDQAAFELIQKERAEPVPQEAVEVPASVFKMGRRELEDAFLEALSQGGDRTRVSQLRYELRRRAAKKRGEQPTLRVRKNEIASAITREVEDSVGVPADDGIPASARVSIRETLGKMTHRDPVTQHAMRTMLYRMMNLNGRTVRGTLQDTNLMTVEDIKRLAKVDDPNVSDTAVFADFASPEFKKLRSDLRRMAVGLNKDKATPMDVMHEIGHVTMRTGLFSKGDRDRIVQAFRDSDDPVRRHINETYAPKYANLSEEQRELLLAEEWFAESWANWAAERVKKGDVWAARLGGQEASLRDRSSLNRLLDTLNEGVAYVVNGLLGRNDVRQMFRRMTFYGDLFDRRAKTPIQSGLAGRVAVGPEYAAAYAEEVLRSSPRSRLDRIRDFVGKGAGRYRDGEDVGEYLPDDPDIRVWFHGTPRGDKFDPNTNPDVVFEPSENGNHGPGIYLTEDPDIASNYSEAPTPRSILRQLQYDGDWTDDQIQDAMFMVGDLTDIRQEIAHLRREYVKLASGGNRPDDFLGAAREMAEEGPSIEDQQAKIVEQIDELLKDEQEFILGLKEQYDIKFEPSVMPIVVNAQSPADFSARAGYDRGSHFLRQVLDLAVANGIMEDREATGWLGTLPPQGAGTLRGGEAYNELVAALARASGTSRADAKSALSELLQEMGHDSLRVTTTNTRRMGQYGGDLVNHDTLVVFRPEQVKHLEASEFSQTSPRLYQSDVKADEAPFVGTAMRTLMEMDETVDDLETRALTPLAEYADMIQAPPKLTEALTSMTRRRAPTTAEEQAIRKAGVSQYWRRNSDTLRSVGFKSLADYFEDHFPDTHQRFAGTFMPMLKALRGLPDTDNAVKRWAKRSVPDYGRLDKLRQQPASYRKIVGALRRGPKSDQWSRLSKQEAEVAKLVRAKFDTQLQKMRDAGILVGERANFYPQIWNPEMIRRNREQFLADMKEYYTVEKRAKGEMTPTPEEAETFAEGIYFTLADEGSDGVFVPDKDLRRLPQGAATQEAKSDHIDYTRLIELDKYPEMMDRLEKYLESDLEFGLTKYFENTERRITMAQRWGNSSHGLFDYMKVADSGVDGIAKLLSTNRVYRKDIKALDQGGYPEDVRLVDDTLMPYTGREDLAQNAANEIVRIHQEEGEGAARKALLDIARDVDPRTGEPHRAYVVRVNAIVDALNDFGGKRSKIDPAEYERVEDLLRVSMKKPLLNRMGGATALEVSRSMRAFNAVTLLGFTTLTSMTDVVLPLVRSGSFSSWAKGMRTLASQSNEDREMVRNIGVAIESIVHERMVYQYGAPDSKFQNAFFNATGLTPWTDTMREVAGVTGLEWFKRLQREAAANFDPSKPIQEQGRKFRKAYRHLNAYGLGEFAVNGQTLGDPKLLTENATLRKGIIKFADQAIFTPNPNDIPLWGQTPIGSMIFQLKSFPLMMMRMGRDVLIDDTKAALRGEGDLSRAAYFLTAGPAFGAGTLALKDVVQMRGGQDDEEASLRNRNILKTLGYEEDLHGNEDNFLGWYFEGMLMMGGLGLMAELIYDTAQNVDNGAFGFQRIMGTVLGPSVGTVGAGINVAGGAKDWAMEGSTDGNGQERQAVREIATRIPVLGGVRGLREGITDKVAGLPEDEQTGWGSSSWGSNGWGGSAWD